jgi:putative N6-adenine-specific DNA methylase
VPATAPSFEIYLVATPGLEAALCDEARSRGFRSPKVVAGGVRIEGKWHDVWRANLELRGTGRVLARIGSFPASHLSQLDKSARKFPWGETLRKEIAVRVEATCKKSKIYHAGAAAQRVATAIHEELGCPLSDDADVCVKIRIEHDICTISIDSSGEMLHKRGHKEAIAKAPIRETLAAMFLQQCGFDGNEPVVDPMCGSGTFIIEAAEMAAGLKPGRTRNFGFEQLATFDAGLWQKMREAKPNGISAVRFHGSDRDAGAIRSAKANAERAGVTTITEFHQHAISNLKPPEGPRGLVIVNPPYGTRIGDKKPLHALYAALGQTLLQRFGGWRVGIVTTDAALAKSCGLPFKPVASSVNHGGLKVYLYQTEKLPVT